MVPVHYGHPERMRIARRAAPRTRAKESMLPFGWTVSPTRFKKRLSMVPGPRSRVRFEAWSRLSVGAGRRWGRAPRRGGRRAEVARCRGWIGARSALVGNEPSGRWITHPMKVGAGRRPYEAAR